MEDYTIVAFFMLISAAFAVFYIYVNGKTDGENENSLHEAENGNDRIRTATEECIGINEDCISETERAGSNIRRECENQRIIEAESQSAEGNIHSASEGIRECIGAVDEIEEILGSAEKKE